MHLIYQSNKIRRDNKSVIIQNLHYILLYIYTNLYIYIYLNYGIFLFCLLYQLFELIYKLYLSNFKQ